MRFITSILNNHSRKILHIHKLSAHIIEKAFCWRFLSERQEIANSGLVMDRSCFLTKQEIWTLHTQLIKYTNLLLNIKIVETIPCAQMNKKRAKENTQLLASSRKSSFYRNASFSDENDIAGVR